MAAFVFAVRSAISSSPKSLREPFLVPFTVSNALFASAIAALALARRSSKASSFSSSETKCDFSLVLLLDSASIAFFAAMIAALALEARFATSFSPNSTKETLLFFTCNILTASIASFASEIAALALAFRSFTPSDFFASEIEFDVSSSALLLLDSASIALFAATKRAAFALAFGSSRTPSGSSSPSEM